MKKHLITGILILLPVALTIFVFVFLIDLFTDPFLALIKTVLETLDSNIINHPEALTLIARAVALLFLFLLTLILGALARSIFLNRLVYFINYLLAKMPLIKSVHKISQDVFSSIISDDEKRAFNTPVIVPFPSSKTFVVGFKTGKTPPICQEHSQDTLIPVFVPTVHLLTGCLILVPEKEVREISMSRELAVKFTISCGIVTSENDER